MSSYLTNRVWIDVVKQVLSEAGHDANVCLDSGLYQSAGGQNQQVDTRASGEAWRVAAELTGEPSIGLIAAKKYFQPAMWGSLGLAVICSPTLRQAMQRMVLYSRYFSNVAPFALIENEDSLSLEITPLVPSEIIGYESADFAVASFVSLFRELHPAALNPVAVHLLRDSVNDQSLYQDFYQCDITLGTKASVISFALEGVDRLLPLHNEQLAIWQDQFTETYIQQLECPELINVVKRCVIEAIEAGEEPSCKKIAEQHNLSQRSLQRKLSAKDTTFTEVVSEVRKQLALQYLKTPQVSLNETAYRLGFSDHSSFTRAFKRWYGKSPTEYCG